MVKFLANNNWGSALHICVCVPVSVSICLRSICVCLGGKKTLSRHRRVEGEGPKHFSVSVSVAVTTQNRAMCGAHALATQEGRGMETASAALRQTICCNFQRSR